MSATVLEGDRIGEIASFITPTTEGGDRELFARYPDQAMSPGKVADLFERFGLPARLD